MLCCCLSMINRCKHAGEKGKEYAHTHHAHKLCTKECTKERQCTCSISRAHIHRLSLKIRWALCPFQAPGSASQGLLQVPCKLRCSILYISPTSFRVKIKSVQRHKQVCKRTHHVWHYRLQEGIQGEKGSSLRKLLLDLHDPFPDPDHSIHT